MSQDFSKQLINSVKVHNCIYMRNHHYYTDRIERNRAWDDIAVNTKKTTFECRYRWKSLRERFSIELIRLERSRPYDSHRRVEWKYFKPMMFLKPYIQRRSNGFKGSKPNLKLADESTRESTTSEDGESSVKLSAVPSVSLEAVPIPTIAGNNEATVDIGHDLSQSEVMKEKIFEPPSYCNTTTDHLFVKTVYSLMDELTVDEKDTFFACVFAKIMEIRKQSRETKKSSV